MDVFVAGQKELCGIKKLWLDSFADTTQYVDFFFEENDFFSETAKHFFVVAREGSKIVSMAGFMRCEDSLGANDVYYMFGVATDKNYRKQGLLKKTEKFAVELIEKKGSSMLLLVPAEPFLFEVYSKLSYDGVTMIGRSEVTLIEGTADVTLTNLDINDFKKMRNIYYNGFNSVRVDDEYIYKEAVFEGKKLIKAECGLIKGYLICEIDEGTLNIIETNLDAKELSMVVSRLKEDCNIEFAKVYVTNHENRHIKYGMYKNIGRNKTDKFDIYMNLMLK